VAKILINFGRQLRLLKSKHQHGLTDEDKVAALVWVAVQHHAHGFLNKTILIENKNQEVTCDALFEAMYRIWRMNGAGKEGDLNKKELSIC
jgi:hypothetical protein